MPRQVMLSSHPSQKHESSNLCKKEANSYKIVRIMIETQRDRNAMKISSITNETRLRLIDLESRNGGELNILIDRDGPNWLALDGNAKQILERFDGSRNFGEVVGDYAGRTGYEFAKAWQHVETLTRDAIRQKVLVPGTTNGDADLAESTAYPGRATFLSGVSLKELWIHTNNWCNLQCAHCLVSSGPDEDRGLPMEKLIDVVRQARDLGCERFYFTGGEPFMRKDIFELIDEVLSDQNADLAILTNGMLFTEDRLARLRNYDLERFAVQISLDGSTPELNDPIRGKGSFEKITEGIRKAVEAGLNPTITTAITKTNAGDIPRVTELAADLGVKNHHLLWLHRRGRALDEGFAGPTNDELTTVVRDTIKMGSEVGVSIDNYESHKTRLRYPAHTKRDLASAGVQNLCVYCDGKVYPSAAMANIPDLVCGDITEESLEEILRSSEVCKRFRETSVETKEICRTCPIKFICGGGDIEHAYFYGGSTNAHDPYCELHQSLIYGAMNDLASERSKLVSNGKSGYNAPVIITGMGDGGAHCALEEALADVITSASECVRSWDLDAPRKKVREFYGDAAEEPQEDLCCPIKPSEDDLAHIPSEVIERYYGCGSPIEVAELREGESMLDLGSGAGIDVFRAAKRVGPSGRAIGIDMTDQMLEVADEAKSVVAGNLGYDVTEFKKGYLEDVPVEDGAVDLVTSNCVINLSPDKKQVLGEIWRILKDNGRMVISDIVSQEEVPVHQRQDPRLWGECISGALTEEELIAYMERAGFYGVQVLARSFWKEVEGHKFYSVTVRGYKFEKKAGCVFNGQTAIYKGPFRGVADEEGHWFPRNAPVEICTDTAAKLSRQPYDGMFLITDPTREADPDFSCCSPDDSAGSCC